MASFYRRGREQFALLRGLAAAGQVARAQVVGGRWRAEQAGSERGAEPCRAGPSCRVRVWEVFLENSNGEPGGAVSRTAPHSDLHFREVPPGSSLEALLPVPLLYVSLGHSPGTPSGGAHTAHCQLCGRAAVTTSAPSMRTAFGAKEELRAGLEMKPIMGFLNICFILALNARPP